MTENATSNDTLVREPQDGLLVTDATNASRLNYPVSLHGLYYPTMSQTTLSILKQRLSMRN